MDRSKFKLFLEEEIKKERQRISQLGRSKSGGDSARSSWSSQDMRVIEEEIANRELYLLKCQAALEAVEANPHSRAATDGSIVTLSIQGEKMTYLMVADHGGPIGDYLTLSRKSPIGKAVWGRKKGEAVTAPTPDGKISVSIIAVT